MVTVGIVCEGPTDLPVLRAVIETVLDSLDIQVIPIHPLVDEDEAGGWTEVRKWCLEWSHIIQWLPQQPDLVVVQMDADRCAANSAANVNELCDVVKNWLGPALTQTRPQVVIVLPKQATDLWLYGALRTDITPQDEDVMHPEIRLAEAGFLRRDQDGKPVKDRDVYAEQARHLPGRLGDLELVFGELRRFTKKLRDFAGATPAAASS